jgi:hypothetical protein
VVEEGVHIAPQRLRWVPQNLVRHGCTTLPCLHWYTSVVSWRHWNSSMWWHIILASTFFFLGCGRTFLYNPSSLVLLHRHKKSFL